MGFPMSLQSSLVLPYTAYRGGTVYANSDLLAGGRNYEEELASVTARATPDKYGSTAYRRPCALWGNGDVITVYAFMRGTWPTLGYFYRRWQIDVYSGDALVFHDLRTGYSEGSRELLPDSQLFAEPYLGATGTSALGSAWRFGREESTDYHGPQQVKYDGTTVQRQLNESSYGLTGYAVDFAIDTPNNRIWFRMSGDDVGKVRMFKPSDYSLVATLYASNTTKSIVPTGDGFVWLIDSFDWHHLYDYDGAYWGSLRNPLGAIPTGGRAYGWEPRTRRLLELTGTASGAAGVSTLYLRAFYPNAQAAYLSKVVPRDVPRKGQTSYFFAHCYGEGGEPIASRPVSMTASVPLGIAAGVASTDGDGDVVYAQTPATAATNTADIAMTGRTRIRGTSAITLPTGTINVWSTNEFQPTGTIQVEYQGGTFGSVTYSGKTATSFTGCSGGSGTCKVNGEVVQ